MASDRYSGIPTMRSQRTRNVGIPRAVCSWLGLEEQHNQSQNGKREHQTDIHEKDDRDRDIHGQDRAKGIETCLTE